MTRRDVGQTAGKRGVRFRTCARVEGPRNRRSQLNWAQLRSEYVTGDETYAQLASRVDVSSKTVEKHALNREANGGRTWGDWRQQFRDDVAGQATEITQKIRIQGAVLISMQHATLLAELAAAAAEAVKGALAECRPRDKILLALEIMAIQRRIHGLDKSPVQLEVTGKDGNAIEHDLTHAFEDDPEATEFAIRALHVVFGKTVQPEASDLPSEATP